MTNCNDCLFKLFLGQHVSEVEFSDLLQSSTKVKYQKGECIIRQGVKANHLLFLSQGRVKFNFENQAGKNVILTVTAAPGLLGGFNLVNNDLSMFSIVAIDTCEVCLVSMERITALLRTNSELAFKMLGFVTSAFKDSVLNFVNLSHKQVNGRMADILLYLSGTVYRDRIFHMDLSRKELSEFAGCSRENVIHTLSRFHREGIIRAEGKIIEILDQGRLENISRLG